MSRIFGVPVQKTIEDVLVEVRSAMRPTFSLIKDLLERESTVTVTLTTALAYLSLNLSQIAIAVMQSRRLSSI